jgi:hypothetical protein
LTFKVEDKCDNCAKTIRLLNYCNMLKFDISLLLRISLLGA